jgi:L-ascorbate metabolism protein UlaG (beta-lactamase superfamily)
MKKRIILGVVLFLSVWAFIDYKTQYFIGESSNMKDGRFYNSFDEQIPVISSSERHEGKSVWKWFIERYKTRIKWTEEDIKNFAKYKEYEKFETRDDLSVVYVTHSTFLIQIEGVNILTDPIWSEVPSPISFIGPKRRTQAGVKIEELPKIDYILLSHSHFDHLDLPTLKKLKKTFNPTIIAGLGVCNFLKRNGIKNCIERDWGGEVNIMQNFSIFFEKAKHWSKRGLFDANKLLWGSFVIKSPNFQVYFAGDTGYGGHFKMIGKKYGSFDIALIPIGAYEPRFIMKYSHLNPEEAVLAHKELNSKRSFGMHLKTFQLSDEGFNSPVTDLEKQNLTPNNFTVLDFGERFHKSL